MRTCPGHVQDQRQTWKQFLKCNMQTAAAKPGLKWTSADLDKNKYMTILSDYADFSYMHECFRWAFAHQDTEAADVWFTSSPWLPCIPECPVLLVLWKQGEYLDPVSVSLQTTIIQSILIESALIAVSSNGHSMNSCVCHVQRPLAEFWLHSSVSPRVWSCWRSEALTWQVLCWWSGVRLWIELEGL